MLWASNLVVIFNLLFFTTYVSSLKFFHQKWEQWNSRQFSQSITFKIQTFWIQNNFKIWNMRIFFLLIDLKGNVKLITKQSKNANSSEYLFSKTNCEGETVIVACNAIGWKKNQRSKWLCSNISSIDIHLYRYF